MMLRIFREFHEGFPHPRSSRPGSFNHAICATAIEALQAGGHECRFHDLYAEGFDPVMTAAELPKDAVLPADIERHCQEIGEADGVIVVHPTGGARRRPSSADGAIACCGPAAPTTSCLTARRRQAVGLLRAKVGLVFTTANTPTIRRCGYSATAPDALLKVVFACAGSP